MCDNIIKIKTVLELVSGELQMDENWEVKPKWIEMFKNMNG